MICITGDTHREFLRTKEFITMTDTTADDIMIILGDNGINYYNDKSDRKLKARLSKNHNITYFLIKGNHDMRPENIAGYKEKEFYGGKVLYEPDYPNLLFAIDSEIYNFNGLSCMVIGGAYSVDKFYRLERGWNWFPDEQPTEEIKERVEKNLTEREYIIDVMLTHICPLKYEPTEAFLSAVVQSTVDKTTEEWLDKIEDKRTYKKWYCGHYHISKKIDKLQFMFNDFEIF